MTFKTIIEEQYKHFIIGILTFALLMLVLPIRPAMLAMVAVSILTELLTSLRHRTWMFNSLGILATIAGAMVAYLIALI
jgi:hypothetical protein